MKKIIHSQIDYKHNRGFFLVELITEKIIEAGGVYTSFDELSEEPMHEHEIQIVHTHGIKGSILENFPLQDFNICEGGKDSKLGTYLRPIAYEKDFEAWWNSVKKETSDD